MNFNAIVAGKEVEVIDFCRSICNLAKIVIPFTDIINKNFQSAHRVNNILKESDLTGTTSPIIEQPIDLFNVCIVQVIIPSIQSNCRFVQGRLNFDELRLSLSRWKNNFFQLFFLQQFVNVRKGFCDSADRTCILTRGHWRCQRFPQCRPGSCRRGATWFRCISQMRAWTVRPGRSAGHVENPLAWMA